MNLGNGFSRFMSLEVTHITNVLKFTFQMLSDLSHHITYLN